MNSFAWGDEQTRFFFELTPDRVMSAVEVLGIRCTGRCLPMGSMENRVYDVEIESESEKPLSLPERSRVVKFYRPGRWSETQILEEHRFLRECEQQEIPVVSPLEFPSGKTLEREKESQIYYAVFPKRGGRSPQELNTEQLEQVGRLLARIHGVGSTWEAPSRVKLDVQTYGVSNLEFLLKENWIPEDYRANYELYAREIFKIADPWFKEFPTQRIHGDCHLGNLLWGDKGFYFLDFDDFVRGPCIQDFWLLLPGKDESTQKDLNIMLDAYEQMRPIDRKSTKLIEPLRALRFIHFGAWMAKRWKDPAFPLNFPFFNTDKYWEGQVWDLREQLRFIKEISWA